MLEWEYEKNQDVNEDDEIQEVQNGSVFEHRAIPLDELETLDADGNQYSIKELMQLKDLREELGD